MSLFVSAPSGLSIIGGRVLAVTTLGWCLLPVLIGGMGRLVLDMTGAALPAQTEAAWQALFHLMLLSPLISAPFWIAVGIGTALFTRRGLYGSLTALGWGALTGAAAAMALDATSLIATGAIMATFHRFSLAVLRPMAF